MKPRILLLLALAIVLQACGGTPKKAAVAAAEPGLAKDGHFRVSLTWLTELKAETYLQAKLRFSVPSGAAVTEVKDLKFDPWMPSMGHGTVTDEQTLTLEAGQADTILVDRVYFIMGGAWDVRLDATVNGQADSATLSVEVP
jgi:hypothetical protein